MTGATYWCKKQTAIVLVSDRQRNAASQKLSKPMILARYFIHVWIGVRPDCAQHAGCRAEQTKQAETNKVFGFRPSFEKYKNFTY